MNGTWPPCVGSRCPVGDTADGWGPRFDGDDRRIEIRVDDVYERIATATVHSAVYVDYLQLVRTPDGWTIANVLWEWTPEGRALRASVVARSVPRDHEDPFRCTQSGCKSRKPV
ncbi:MAG: nuclear transport factor 2 family protein, partial [Actinobacteria bacterium]|nr:nuclear transport factor 2 family protein [Actinomycetota bacterium]